MLSDAEISFLNQNSVLRKHAVLVSGHKTSVSMEPAFWEALKQIAKKQGLSLNQLISDIDAVRTGNLSSAIRLYVLHQWKK